MLLIRAVLTCKTAGRCDERDAAQVVDALWAHARQGDGLEHVRGRLNNGQIAILLFLRESDMRDPERRATELIERTFRRSTFVQAAFERPASCADLPRLSDGPNGVRANLDGPTIE